LSAFSLNIDNKKCVDHIDRNPSNNNIRNLRWATDSENKMNCKKRTDNNSGCTGIYFRKDTHTWTTYINVNGKRENLRCFKTKEKAIAVRKERADQLFGTFNNKFN
jgi:hypothetical protein